MKRAFYISEVLASLVVLTLLVTIASAIYIPPDPPSVPPTISNVTVPKNQATGTSATVKCSVSWHYQPGSMRSVKIKVPSISSTWYSMSTSDAVNFWYLRTGLNPATQYSFTIKATEQVWYEPFGDWIYLTTYANGIIDDCIPSVSVSISNIQEQQATCNFAVDWGRTTYSSYHQNVYVEYKHGQGTIWKQLDPITYNPSNPSVVLTGLVMSTLYDCKVKVTHDIYVIPDFIPFESEWSSTTFTSSSWTPNRKYALNINLNGDPDDGVYYAHHNTIDYMDGLNWAGWGYIEHTVTIPDGSTADVLTGDGPGSTPPGELRWPNWYTTPSDSNSLVFIFIVGHGGIGKLHIGGMPTPPECEASEYAIAQAIASISFGKLILVIEACYSGSLIDGIVSQLGSVRMRNTLIITSANATMVAGCMNTAGSPTTDDKCTFSSAFLPVIASGGSFYSAFDAGAEYCYDNPASLPEWGVDYQDPRLDDIDDNPDVTVKLAKENGIVPLIIGKDGQLAYVLRLY